jgi:hypothetical protein
MSAEYLARLQGLREGEQLSDDPAAIEVARQTAKEMLRDLTRRRGRQVLRAPDDP